MIKKIFITLTIAICLLNVSASVVLAEDGLVKCGRTGEFSNVDSNGNPISAAEQCGFSDLIELINSLINYLIMIAMPLSAIAFAYAGWLYLTAGGNTGQVDKAKGVFADVGIGLIIILSGWLLFKFIETTFLNTGNGYSSYLN